MAQAFVDLLNAGVHPVVPATGSIGASDLMHMAAIAQVFLGRGRAELGGEVMPGAEALAAAGLTPIELEPKDGLTLISANGVAIGHAALLVDRAERIAAAADLVLAASLEATAGNPSVLDEAVLRAKRVHGQLAAGASIRGFLTGSALFQPGGPRSVQDPLSFRVGPQVHGAFREFVTLLRSAAQLELNAMDDNPLVDVASGRMLSNGNFHPMVLALALDALRPAAAHVGQLSDRRMNHLWASVSDVFSDEDVMARLVESGGGLSRYAAAALASELRHAASPVTLDIGILDLGVEDHATNAPVAAALTEHALDLLEGILAIELDMARIVHDVTPGLAAPAPAVAAAFRASTPPARRPGSRRPPPRSTRPRQTRSATRCSRRPGRRSRRADRAALATIARPCPTASASTSPPRSRTPTTPRACTRSTRSSGRTSSPAGTGCRATTRGS